MAPAPVLEALRTFLGVQIGILKERAQAPADMAEAWLGLDTGLAVACEIRCLVKAVRHTRRSNFRFSNPPWPVFREFVTEHEQMLIRIIMAGQKMDMVGARTTAIMLSERHDENPLPDAAAIVAQKRACARASAQPTRNMLH